MKSGCIRRLTQMIKTDNFKEVFFSRDRSVSDKFFSLMRTANALQSKLADSNKKNPISGEDDMGSNMF